MKRISIIGAGAWGTALALVVRRVGCDCTPVELTEHLAPHFPKFWLPSGFEFVDAIPRTSVGKPNKRAMRDSYIDHFMQAEIAPAETAAVVTP